MPRTSKPSHPVSSKQTLPTLQTNQVSKTSIVSTPAEPSFGQMMKQGLAWGTGQAIAHRMFGPTVTVPIQTKMESSCEKERLSFEACMKTKTSEDFCGEEQMIYTRCLHPPQ